MIARLQALLTRRHRARTLPDTKTGPAQAAAAARLARYLPDPAADAGPPPEHADGPPQPFYGAAPDLIIAGLTPLQAHQALYAPELLPPDLRADIERGRYGRLRP